MIQPEEKESISKLLIQLFSRIRLSSLSVMTKQQMSI